jgi:hypothetical protein
VAPIVVFSLVVITTQLKQGFLLGKLHPQEYKLPFVRLGCPRHDGCFVNQTIIGAEFG